jgi:hypothetical protein
MSEDEDEEDDIPLLASARPRAQRQSAPDLAGFAIPKDSAEDEDVRSRSISHKRPAQSMVTNTPLRPAARASSAKDATAKQLAKSVASDELLLLSQEVELTPVTRDIVQLKSASNMKKPSKITSSSFKTTTASQPAHTQELASTSKHKTKRPSITQFDDPINTASIAKKSAGKVGADLLSNWTAQPPKRIRTVPEDKPPRMYNFSAKWNAEKAGRNSVAPNADDIPLAEPANMRGAELELPVTAQPRLAMSSAVAAVHPASEEQVGNRILLSCIRWQNGNCVLGSDRCPFLHKSADETSSDELYCQFLGHYNRTKEWRKFIDDPNNICRYWANQGCTKSNTVCPVAHWYWSNSPSHTYMKSNPLKKPQTCFFLWQNGYCQRGDNDCIFSHEYLPGSVAFGPRGVVPNKNPHRMIKSIPVTALDSQTLTVLIANARFVHSEDMPASSVREGLPDAEAPIDNTAEMSGTSATNLSTNDLIPDASFAPIELGANTKDSTVVKSSNSVSVNSMNLAAPQSLSTIPPTVAGGSDRVKCSQTTQLMQDTTPPREATKSIDFDSTNSMQNLSTLPVSLQIPGEEGSRVLEIEGLSPIAKSFILCELGTLPHVVLNKMCLQSDLRKFVLPQAPNTLGNGDIVGAMSKSMTELSNLLILNGSVAIFRGASLLIIVYPTLELSSKYSFLERSGRPQTQCQLSIQIREVVANKLNVREPASKDSPHNIDQLFRAKFGISKRIFFTWSNEPEGLGRNVFIMIDKDRLAESEIMSRYFREIGARVWTSALKGAWESFLAEKSGAVVVRLHAISGSSAR